MSLPYVQLTREEAISAKRDILSSEMNILSIVKEISGYKKLRKQETAKKIGLKKSLKQGIVKVNSLLRELPDVDNSGIKAGRLKENTAEEGKKKSIESELRNIQEKLSRLNRG